MSEVRQTEQNYNLARFIPACLVTLTSFQGQLCQRHRKMSLRFLFCPDVAIMVDWAIKIRFCVVQLIQCVVAPYIKNGHDNAVCDWCVFNFKETTFSFWFCM